MYLLINKNIEDLMNGINRKEHIQPYIDICRAFQNCRTLNESQRSLYRKFYQLNAARLADSFCDEYFNLLIECQDSKKTDVESVVNTLHEIPCNAKGVKAIHFSFATKLVHTIDTTLPIYDSMVAKFYFLPELKMNWKSAKKISEYLLSYNFLRTEYKRIIDQHLLDKSITRFREKFNLESSYSSVKVIDTLIWRYTAFLKSGAIRDGRIKYGTEE